MNAEHHSSGANQISSARPTAPVADQGKGFSPWYGIPWDVGGRIGLLFLALCLIKLFMLVEFRKHLFQIHWYTTGYPNGCLNQIAFYIFIGLVGLNLWRLGQKCAAINVRAVRTANACILVLGFFFIFLTFHTGANNYLEPLMVGTLKWRDLNAYLSLAFFFNMPFLAVWLLAYALIYYGLARTGRQHLMLYVTAGFAVLYLAICLRSLAAYRDALLAADCLGIVCLLTGSRSKGPLKWFYLIQPLGWLVSFFLLFRHQEMSLENLDPEFAMLSGWCVILYCGLSVIAWRGNFYPAWSWILPFAFVAVLLLTTINYPISANFQALFILGLTLPHYFLGEFSLALVLLCVGKIYRQWLPRASLLWLDTVNLILIALALADWKLSHLMGIRLDWQAVAFGADFKMVWRMAKPFLPVMAAGLVLFIGLYAIVTGLWQRKPLTKSLNSGPGGCFLLGVFLLLGITGDWLVPKDKAEGETAILLAQTSPLLSVTMDSLMDRKTFMDTAKRFGMGQMLRKPDISPTRPLRRLNVLLIFQESSYNKYLSLFNGRENTQPLLSGYKDRMEIFPDFFSNFAASINARFATFSGLYPARNYEKFTLNRVNVKTLFDILSGAGYQCSVFDSAFMDYSGFRDFLTGRGIQNLYDADNMPEIDHKPQVAWGLREEVTADAIRAQIAKYASNRQPFFISYTPVAPHNPFDGVPDRFRKYKLKQINNFTPLYLNELLYMDWCITSILDQLKTSGLLDNTLVLITDDHGEMLGEDGGYVGHGWSARPDLTNIPLIIMDPANPGYHINDTVGSQVDLLPTIIDLLGMPLPEDQLYQGASLYSLTAQTDRAIYLNSFQEYAILNGHRYLLGTRETAGSGAASGPTTKTYSLTNEGAHTRFHEIPSEGISSPSIEEFDKFQENLLKNYSTYCQMIRN